MQWGPSTPITVSCGAACHGETSVISLSAPLHPTGAHQSLGQTDPDVPGWASPLAPSLRCVSVSETSACQESSSPPPPPPPRSPAPLLLHLLTTPPPPQQNDTTQQNLGISQLLHASPSPRWASPTMAVIRTILVSMDFPAPVTRLDSMHKDQDKENLEFTDI